MALTESTLRGYIKTVTEAHEDGLTFYVAPEDPKDTPSELDYPCVVYFTARSSGRILNGLLMPRWTVQLLFLGQDASDAAPETTAGTHSTSEERAAQVYVELSSRYANDLTPNGYSTAPVYRDGGSVQTGVLATFTFDGIAPVCGAGSFTYA